MTVKTKLETITCPHCNSDSWQVIAKANAHNPNIEGKFSIVRCNVCELNYLNPRPDRETLGYFYGIIQQNNTCTSERDISANEQLSFVKRLWHRLNYSNPVIAMIDSEPILDVGCGRGELLSELSKKGYKATGLEFNPLAVEVCLRKGLNVMQGDVMDFDFPENYYKCIVLSHSLEHFSDPVAVLQKLKKVLSPDGKIVIAVPYAKSMMIPLFGNCWHGWDPPFHLVHFDKSTIQKICNKAGLTVTKIKVGGHPEDFTRSWAIWSGRRHRYLILRVLLWSFFLFASLFGQGSYLLVSAEAR